MTKESKQTSKEAQAWLDYAELSKYLFSEDAPLNVNEIPESNKFHQPAKDMAQEFDMDWENLTQDESNRIMINLLGDFFMNIRENEDEHYTLSITVCKSDKKLKGKGDESTEVQS